MADHLTKVMTVCYPSRMRQIPTACGVVHSYLSGGTSEVSEVQGRERRRERRLEGHGCFDWNGRDFDGRFRRDGTKRMHKVFLADSVSA